MSIRNKIDARTFYFNEILSKWIAHHTNINIKSIKSKRLLWFSYLIVFINDYWQDIIKYYPAQTKCKPSYELYSTLSNRLLLTLKTDIIYDLPKTRFFNITGYIRLFIYQFE